jgi:hypothetical protein
MAAPGSGNYHYDQYGLEFIEFGNGVVWGQSILRQMSVADDGVVTNDTIVGTAGSDTINAGSGNDTLYGEQGDDTYLYARGNGHDVIVEHAFNGNDDRLILQNIDAADVMVARNGNDATLVVGESAAGAGGAGSVLLKASLNDSNGQGVEKVVFADGTVWTRTDLVAQADATASFASGSGAVSVDLSAGTAAVTSPAISGRFVRLYQTNGNYLSLAEVQVMESGQNIATLGTATQSSTGWGSSADRANDGNTDGNYNNNSVTHSGSANIGE